jgi:hypothetical protein
MPAEPARDTARAARFVRCGSRLAQPVEKIKLAGADTIPFEIFWSLLANSACPVTARQRVGRDFISGFGMWCDWRQTLEPPAQVFGEHKCATATLYCAKVTGADRLVERRPTRTRD